MAGLGLATGSAWQDGVGGHRKGPTQQEGAGLGGFRAVVRRRVRAGRGLVLTGVCVAALLSGGCAVVRTGSVSLGSSVVGANAPAPSLSIADYARDLGALTSGLGTMSDAALQAMATRPLPVAAGQALDLALLTRALAQRLRDDHIGLAQTRQMAWRRGTQREVVLHVLALHAAALRTAGLTKAAREAFTAAERYMLDTARLAAAPVHRSEASRAFLQEYLFAARHFGDTPLGDRIVDQYLGPMLQDAAVEPPLKLIGRLYADEYRITQRVNWGGGEPLAGHDALVALVAAQQDAVAGLDGSVGGVARRKLMDLRLQAGHLALRAHRPSLAAAQLRAVESADTDEAARRFAAGELRAAIALAGHEFERALAVIDSAWQQAPGFIHHLGVVRAGHRIGRAGVLASLGRWADAERELGTIRIDPAYLTLVDQFIGLRTVVRAMLDRDDPDLTAFLALAPKYRDGGQGVDRSVLYYAARTVVLQRRGARSGSMADVVQAVDAGRRMSRFLRLHQAAGTADHSTMAPLFLRIAKEAYALAALRAQGRPGVTADDLLDAVQMLQASDIDRDITAAALRQHAFPGIEAADLRQLQDLQRSVAATQAALGAELAAADADTDGLRQRVDAANAASARLQAQLAAMMRAAPGVRYAFRGGEPLSLREIQSQLAVDEGLFGAVPMSASTLVLLVTKRGVAHQLAPVGRSEVSALVQRVRRSTDLTGFARLPDFDTDAARQLFHVLLGWRPRGLRGLASLTVAASGPLAALPFGLLLRADGRPSAATDYRRLPWLVRSVALAHVPSLSSWLALAQAPAGGAAGDFIAWADPDFAGDGGAITAPPGGVRASLRAPGRALRALAGDALEGVVLPPLPETRREAQAMARALSTTGAADILAGAVATRRSVLERSASGDLARRSVVLFATHGLGPQQWPGLDQPALAMARDGAQPGPPLLTLEDVLGLRLRADWVILSACNTASADRDGGDPLSGLSRGFLFAGARALLVTHWEVESDSAAALTTRTVEAFARQTRLSRAQALRQASLALIDARDTPPQWAHPAYWASFALVGDGGRRRHAGMEPGSR